MPNLELTDEQVVELLKQLPPDRRQAVLLKLAGGDDRRSERMVLAEAQLRRLCAERGLDWDSLSEDERERLVDDLIHEDRSCDS